MSKQKRATTQGKIEKRLKEGRGQKNGANYQPWIRVQDFSSYGQTNRDFSWITERQHDLLSKGEHCYFLILHWSATPIVDIQEQFPLLPIEDTLSIAEHYRLRHPVNAKTKEPIVMTTDFLITLPRPIETVQEARTFKLAADLSDKNVIEKLEIERRFWKAKGIDWGVVTEREINTVAVQNILWVYKARSDSSLQPLPEKRIRQIAATLTEMVLQTGERALYEIALDCDDRLGLKLGTSIDVARHLIASKQWLVDITKPIDTCRKLDLLGVSMTTAALRKAGIR